MTRPVIYFLCTGNSCRSQIAEGFAKHYLPDWDVHSAGIEQHGLNPKAVRAMQEQNIDISGQMSDLIDPDLLKRATIVVTLCGDARDNCPVIPSHVRQEHWGFDDPARATGTEAEQWAVFRRVRDQIAERIQRFANEEASN
ncbi:arsenate reductase (thioredoxin) [Exiguobacterium sp. KRL4]|uniref:arsenate reductase (thioredoxin) n=1 Tax=Exiguobacterium sp. KRL4 TaxID=1914536 RepID=UPI0008F7FE23|nr:arsenate reductase (thioredoxin) [Exiguobacterium sp. KRL4]OIN65968.1 arsenate reductase (thioredoxin) [Exiguobacterium sp. KRL4]